MNTLARMFSTADWLDAVRRRVTSLALGLKAMYARHWAGQMDAVQVLVLSPALILLAAVVVFGLLWVAVWLSYSDPSWISMLLVGLALLVLLAAPTWWIVGAWRTSLRLLAERQAIAAALIFALCVWLSIELIRNWAPALASEWQDVAQKITEISRTAPVEDPDPPWDVRAHPELGRIVVTGPLGHGSAKALDAVVSAHPELRLVELDSPGGLVSEESLSMEVIRRHGLSTLVLNRCASACTGVFLAGQRRFITPDSRFGFHQSGYTGRPRDTNWDMPEYESSIFFRSRNVAEWFVLKAHSTSYYELWWPHPLDLMESGYATGWWSQRGPEYR